MATPQTFILFQIVVLINVENCEFLGPYYTSEVKYLCGYSHWTSLYLAWQWLCVTAGERRCGNIAALHNEDKPSYLLIPLLQVMRRHIFVCEADL